MSPFVLVKTYVDTIVVPRITQDIEAYDARRTRAKKEFLNRMTWVRVLGGLAGAMLVASALRLDELLVMPFKLDASLFAKLLNGTGILLGFFTLWMSRGLNERGLLKGWTRYAKARQTLIALERELSDVIRRHEAAHACCCPRKEDDHSTGVVSVAPASPKASDQTAMPTDPPPCSNPSCQHLPLEAVVTAIFDVIQRARLVPVQETDQWALDAMADLTAYVKSAGDVGSISRAAISNKAPDAVPPTRL